MSGGSTWGRQRTELEAYNTFYTSFTGRAATNSFSNEGYYIRGLFTEIPVTGGPNASPDFVLYNGESLILAEVKQGNNINPRHIKQVKRLSNVTIEKAEKYLKDNRTHEETEYDGSVSNIEPCIVYTGLDEEYITKCRTEWESCREQLEEIENVAPVLAAQAGDLLRVVAGEFSDDGIQSWLTQGIRLPPTPKKEFFLTDGLEKESIAVAICLNWGQRAVKGSSEVRVTVSDVRSEFDYRAPDIEDVADTLRVLEHVGACDRDGKRSDQCYIFSPSHMSTVLNIEQIVSEKPINDYLAELGPAGEDSKNHRNLDEFSSHQNAKSDGGNDEVDDDDSADNEGS